MRASAWIGATTGVTWAAGLALHHGTAGLILGAGLGVVLALIFPRSRRDSGA
jgi:hypothetical protein